MSARGGAIATLLIAGTSAALLAWAGRAARDRVQCGPGFVVRDARCAIPPGACPPPLAWTPRGCDAPPVKIAVPACDVEMGPSDWQPSATSAGAPRVVHVDAFALDAFEVTVGAFDSTATRDLARAASDVSYADAARFCAARGGRLPTREERIAAALPARGASRAGAASAPRYPWGDTGAVCRRAAWGLRAGPCAFGASAGPDTVGAHPEGDTPLGVHDLAGNVAEWVAPARAAPPAAPAAVGGSWESSLATDLRLRADETSLVPALVPNPTSSTPSSSNVHDARIGFRCAYPP